MEVMQAPATLTSLADRGEAALALLDGACRSQERTATPECTRHVKPTRVQG